MSEVIVVSKEELREIIREEVRAAAPAEQHEEYPTWWTLRRCAEKKGVSFEVLRKLPRKYRPNFGKATCLVDGSRSYREVYHVSHVLPWLEMTNEDIDAAYEQELRREISA